MRLGWVGEHDGIACEPVPGVASQLKCRGQVTAATRTVAYEVTLKERGYRPEPYAIADALMYADGKPIVEITNMCVRFTGLTREGLRSLWASRERERPEDAVQVLNPSPVAHAPGSPAVFDRDHLLAFAVGKPSEAFGEPYRVFDEQRFIARLPGPPFLCIDRITRIEAEPWKLKAGGVIEAEYDVPPDAWYFEADRQDAMPFAILLETALQPCGWLAAYCGAALTSPDDLCLPQPRRQGGTAPPRCAAMPVTLTTARAPHRGVALGRHDYPDFRLRPARRPRRRLPGEHQLRLLLAAGPGPAGRRPRRVALPTDAGGAGARAGVSTIPPTPRFPINGCG